VSDQDRDKLTKDEDATEDVEAHKHGHRELDDSPSEDTDNDVEAHKHGGKDS
jgi:hypothetical protein